MPQVAAAAGGLELHKTGTVESFGACWCVVRCRWLCKSASLSANAEQNQGAVASLWPLTHFNCPSQAAIYLDWQMCGSSVCCQ